MTFVEWADPASGWTVRAGAASHIGNYRENNEDLVYLDLEYPFALVLDGMGGQVAGEVASRTGADTLTHALRRGLSAGAEPRGLIESALRAANETVIALGQSNPDMRNCGTTAVLALFHQHSASISWAGDSPAYRISGDRIEKLTWDHDLRSVLVRQGVISEAEAREHRIRNVLWLYLGNRETDGHLEVRSFVPRPGDRILLATDGVTGVLPDAELLELVRAHPDPRVCAEELVNRALERGSRDNCTCAVLAFEWCGAGPPPDPTDPPQPEPRPARRPWWRFWG